MWWCTLSAGLLPGYGGIATGFFLASRCMSFDVLAPHYRWMEVVLAGEKLQRCCTAFLERISGARNVLILGEGNGRFLVECRRKIPKAHIVCVDASARMLTLAQRRLGEDRAE